MAHWCDWEDQQEQRVVTSRGRGGRWVKRVTIVLSVAVALTLGEITYLSGRLPDEYVTPPGQPLSLSQGYITAAPVAEKREHSIATTVPMQQNQLTGMVIPQEEEMIALRLFGKFPIKQVTVRQQEPPELIVSGEAFGLKMFAAGTIVVGFAEVETADGTSYPGREAGLKEGDVILSVGSTTIKNNEQVGELIAKSQGNPVSLTIEREGERQTLSLQPAKNAATGVYQGGIWVRDSAAGIGTISFVDPKTGGFAGLGHPICDIDTGKMLPVGSGEICEVEIEHIKKGEAGNPGELVGVFRDGEPLGMIQQNDPTGLYGTLFGISGSPHQKTYPLAFKQEVRTGPAQILCRLEGDLEPYLYDVSIVSINQSPDAEIKNLVVKVTDERLLEQTGGIVQGMSGTPIIQNEKLIGAVTHVFVNNATKGYGIFAENMYHHLQQLEQACS